MKVYSKKRAVWGVAGLVIREGENLLDDDLWLDARDAAPIAKALAEGVLVELEAAPERKAEAPKEEREEPALPSDDRGDLLDALGMSEQELKAIGGLASVELKSYHWNKAQDIVSMVDDFSVLSSWYLDEHRASVKKSLEAQIGDLRE